MNKEQQIAEMARAVLKDFAERVKIELSLYRMQNEYLRTDITDKEDFGIWGLDSSEFEVSVCADDGLIDKILKEYLEK